MNKGDTFDRILASLHEAALDDAHWPAASALIDDAVRAKGHSLVFGSGSPEQGIQIFSAGYFRGGQRHEELEREYFDTYYPVDERAPRLRNLPDSQLVHTADLYTDKELKTSGSAWLDRLASEQGERVLPPGPDGRGVDRTAALRRRGNRQPAPARAPGSASDFRLDPRAGPHDVREMAPAGK